MNKLILNLSVLLSFALCGLCLVQWKRETNLTHDKSKLTEDVYTNKVVIQQLEITLKRTQDEVARLDGIRTKLEQTVETNTARIKALSNELADTIQDRDEKRNQVEQYKAALDQANENIKTQNASIVKQNELLKTVAEQRDQQIEEYKKLLEKYNQVVGEYNKLVEEVKKANEAIEAAAQKQQGSKK